MEETTVRAVTVKLVVMKASSNSIVHAPVAFAVVEMFEAIVVGGHLETVVEIVLELLYYHQQ